MIRFAEPGPKRSEVTKYKNPNNFGLAMPYHIRLLIIMLE